MPHCMSEIEGDQGWGRREGKQLFRGGKTHLNSMKGMLGNFGNDFFKFFSFLLHFPSAVWLSTREKKNLLILFQWEFELLSMKNNNGPQAGEGNGKIPK